MRLDGRVVIVTGASSGFGRAIARRVAEEGAHVVIANQSDPRWIRAFRENAFWRVDGRRAFCASPALIQALAPWEETKRTLFLTNMDGHGPMGL